MSMGFRNKFGMTGGDVWNDKNAENAKKYLTIVFFFYNRGCTELFFY